MKQIKYILTFAFLLASCGPKAAPTAGPTNVESKPPAQESANSEAPSATPTTEKVDVSADIAAHIAAEASEFMAFYDGTSGDLGQRAQDALSWLAARDLATDEEKCALFSGTDRKSVV